MTVRACDRLLRGGGQQRPPLQPERTLGVERLNVVGRHTHHYLPPSPATHTGGDEPACGRPVLTNDDAARLRHMFACSIVFVRGKQTPSDINTLYFQYGWTIPVGPTQHGRSPHALPRMAPTLYNALFGADVAFTTMPHAPTPLPHCIRFRLYYLPSCRACAWFGQSVPFPTMPSMPFRMVGIQWVFFSSIRVYTSVYYTIWVATHYV